jgi:hypothetical protein
MPDKGKDERPCSRHSGRVPDVQDQGGQAVETIAATMSTSRGPWKFETRSCEIAKLTPANLYARAAARLMRSTPPVATRRRWHSRSRRQRRRSRSARARYRRYGRAAHWRLERPRRRPFGSRSEPSAHRYPVTSTGPAPPRRNPSFPRPPEPHEAYSKSGRALDDVYLPLPRERCNMRRRYCDRALLAWATTSQRPPTRRNTVRRGAVSCSFCPSAVTSAVRM